MANFHPAINKTLKHEGGYAFDPDDPGGETNFGISKARYPYKDIKNLTKADAIKLYYNDFWLPNDLEKIRDQEIANAVFDATVNHGQGIRITQQALNASGQSVGENNRMGTDTLEALNRANKLIFIPAYVAKRKAYYDALIAKNPRLAKFKYGWYLRASSYLLTNTVKIGGILALIAGYWLFFKK